MPIRKNSLDAFRSLNIGERRAVVLREYAMAKEPITDRQCMRRLKFTDGNSCKPRITELIRDGYLREVKDVKCPETGRTVRLCEITDKAEAVK